MIEAAIYSRLSGFAGLSALVSDRIEPILAPPNPTDPYVTYQRVASDHLTSMEGSVGLAMATFQINSWSQDPDTARAVAEQVRLAMQGFKGTVATIVISLIQIGTDSDEFDPPPAGGQRGWYNARADFDIWYEEAIPA